MPPPPVPCAGSRWRDRPSWRVARPENCCFPHKVHCRHWRMSLSALRSSFAAFPLLLFLVPTLPLAVSMRSEDWFALTLALSPMRGNVHSPPWEESLTGGRVAELRKFLPLPGGEGRGEGERLIPLNSYGLAHASEYFPPPDSAGGWRTAKDAAQVRELAAMDLSKLEQAWEFTQRCTQNGGLLVVRRGYLVFEKYFGRASRSANPDMASTGKAYTSIACGIMLREFRDPRGPRHQGVHGKVPARGVPAR